jgi:hypothetical protein
MLLEFFKVEPQLVAGIELFFKLQELVIVFDLLSKELLLLIVLLVDLLEFVNVLLDLVELLECL